MAQSVIRLPLNRRTGLNPRPVHMTFVEEQVALGQVFIRVLRFSLVDHSTNAPYSFTQAVIYNVIIKVQCRHNIPSARMAFAGQTLLRDGVDLTVPSEGWYRPEIPSPGMVYTR